MILISPFLDPRNGRRRRRARVQQEHSLRLFRSSSSHIPKDGRQSVNHLTSAHITTTLTSAHSANQIPISPSESKDLNQLSALGHFLKGSSATLGLTKVKDSCEKIQHYGANKNDTGDRDEPDDEKCLSNCKKTIEQAKAEFKEVEKILRRFYRDDGSGGATGA